MITLGTKVFALVFMLISFAGGSSTVEAGPTLTPTLISLEATEKEPGLARVWAVDDGEKVKREDLNHPLATSSDNPVWDGVKIALFGARNEIVAFQLILESAAAGAEDIDVFITDLSRGSYSIPNSRAGSSDPYDYRGKHIELFLEHYIKITDPSRGGSAWSQAAKPSSDYLGWVPDALIPLSVDQELGGAPFDIPANSNQGIWVDLWIPPNAPEGLYTGEIQIYSGDQLSHRIPLELSVFNFTIPDESHFPNMFAMAGGEIATRHGVKIDTDEYYEIETRYHQMAHRHRFDLVQAVRNLSQMRRYHHRYLTGKLYTDRYGYDGPGEGIGNQTFSIGLYGNVPTDYGSKPPDWSKESWWQGSNEWAAWFQDNAPHVYISKFLLPDEPDSESDLRAIQAQADWSHSNPDIGNSIPTFITTWIDSDYQGYADVWSTSANHTLSDTTPGTDSEDVKSEIEAGNALGVYNGYRPATGATVIDTDAIDFRVIPWIGWKYDLDHYFYWSTTYWTDLQHDAKRWNIFTNPRTATVQRNGSGTFFYPGEDNVYYEEDRGLPGPIASIRMKNWRRGMQDYEYLWLAQELGLGSEVERLVDQIVPAALWDASRDDPISWPSRGYGFETIRQELAELISEETSTPQDPLPSKDVNFQDVSENHPYRSQIESLYHLGYFSGCSQAPLAFCPERPLSRAEGAVLFGRVVYGPTAEPDIQDTADFEDLSPSGNHSWAAPWAFQLWQGGFLDPCLNESLKFCPDNPMTRLDSVQITLRWIFGPNYVPPEAKGLFTDISIHWWGTGWMEEANMMGILGHCENSGALRSCPYASLTRGEAAAMVVRLLGLEFQ
jgi:hypothetical protein